MEGPRNTRDKIHFGRSDKPEIAVPPLRLLIAADLSAPGANGIRNPVRVDKDSFNEVLRTLCPRILLELEPLNVPGSVPVTAEFPVQDLRSFTPAQLIGARIFDDLVNDRNAVVDLRDGKIRPEEFKSRIHSDVLRGAASALTEEKPVIRSSAPPPQSSRGRDDEVLDSILGMVETAAPSTPAAPSEGAARVQSFIADMFKGSRGSGPADRGRADRAVKDLEAMLASGLNQVLAHPHFRALEASWRGLRFLVDRTEFRDDIELQVVAAGKGQLVACLEKLVEDMDAGVAGVDAVLAAIEFRNTPEDIEIARRAAELAMDLKAPVIISVDPEFFGKRSASEVTRIPQLSAYLESPAFVKWAGLRDAEGSRWLGAAFNRFLLRSSYDPASARLPFPFRETGDGLWGDPVWAIGSLLARSFSQTGWCGHITGVRGGGLLQDLPVRDFVLPSGDTRQIPLESVFLRGREDDFYGAGFLVLQCGEDQDVAALLDAPTVHRPERYSDARATEESRYRSKLSYQMVAGRIARFVEHELVQMAGSGAAEVQREIGAALSRLIGHDAGDAVRVLLAESEERVGYYDLAIEVRPGAAVWPLPVAIQMTLPLRRN